jgi:hypothetical protein
MITHAHRWIAAGAIVGAFGPAPFVAMSSEPDLVAQVEAALPPHVGACVLAIDRGRATFEHAYGLADVETNTP